MCFMNASETQDFERHQPGMADANVSADNLDPPHGWGGLIWAAIFGLLGIAGIVWGSLRVLNQSPALIVMLVGATFFTMGLVSFLSRFVHTPA